MYCLVFNAISVGSSSFNEVIFTLCPKRFPACGMGAWINYDHIKKMGLVEKFFWNINSILSVSSCFKGKKKKRRRKPKLWFSLEVMWNKQNFLCSVLVSSWRINRLKGKINVTRKLSNHVPLLDVIIINPCYHTRWKQQRTTKILSKYFMYDPPKDPHVFIVF